MVIVLFLFYGSYTCINSPEKNAEGPGTKSGKIRASKHIKY